MLLYHMSPLKITKLRVNASKGNFKRIWLCRWSELAWYSKHLRKHHGVPMKYLYMCNVDEDDVIRMKEGVFVSYQDIKPVSRTELEHNHDGDCIVMPETTVLVN
jgi:hypothetical protein